MPISLYPWFSKESDFGVGGREWKGEGKVMEGGVHPNKNLPLRCCRLQQSDPINCWAI